MIIIIKDYYNKRDNAANTVIFAWGLEEPQQHHHLEGVSGS